MPVSTRSQRSEIGGGGGAGVAGSGHAGTSRGGGMGAGMGMDAQGSLRLRKRDEVPFWLAFNPYILGGYRSDLTVGQCVRSIFMLHNETGNIWTHLLPIFNLVSLYVKPGIWPDAPFTFLAATLPSIICLVCSIIYHSFMPLPSHKTYDRLLLVDYLSVFNVMLWPTAFLINGSFHCQETARPTLLALYGVVAAAMLVVAVRANTAAKRLVPFGVMSAFRLSLQIARAAVGQASPRGSMFFLFVEVFGIGGGLLNATRYPEKRWPGMFDTWFNSHQVMHVLTATAQVCVWKAAEADRAWWAVTACPK
mmetsp:Transcript_11162/g.27380  ORF Transcript_11162/g.27380 Transcript_11162/m.27380 type:complete len:307 (-) Transcript_11162:1538-2458(-)